jgi:GNAT superfamily N-acetyltransferase
VVTWQVERLSVAHDCLRFHCGERHLDAFLRRHALENDRRGLGSTYVAADRDRVLGFVTICTSSVHFEHVPAEKLPHYPIPTLLIARLGVDRCTQGAGIGTALVLAALSIAEQVAEQAGVFAVTVEAKTLRAKVFYQERFGFVELLNDPLHLFLTIADLRASGIREA